MRGVLSLVGLLVVVAIVALLARKQLQAVGTAAAPAGTTAATPQEGARELQRKAVDGVTKALEQGAARASEATR